MAILDRARNVVVLRIVYDGPAGAGKTTTVRALSERLGRSWVTPEEAGQRTLYFDWVDYTGGLFEGYQLRCQVVSVPGQQILAERRAYLLGTADAVVHVAAVSAATLAPTLEALRALPERQRQRGEEAVGVVLQANKRDQPDALAAEAIREALAGAGLRVGLVESTAIEGMGIREAFVFAVRLALDRVREQLRTGSLIEGAPEVDDPQTLLERMRAHLGSRLPGPAAAPLTLSAVLAQESGEYSLAQETGSGSTAAQALLAVVEGEHASRLPMREGPRLVAAFTPPEPPDAGTVPSGLIWPPVDGRVCLAEATARPPRLTVTLDGWGAATAEGWRFQSRSAAVFHDIEDGRGSLIHLARLHATHGDVLSRPRCVVLARDGSDRWRLWQIIKARTSLRERLAASLDEPDPAQLARLLADTAHRLIELDERLRQVAQSPLRATLDSTGIFDGATQYVDVVPDNAGAESPSRVSIERELLPVLRDWSARKAELMVALRRGAGVAPAATAQMMLRICRLLEL